MPPAPAITIWITNPPLDRHALTGTWERLHSGSPGLAQDTRTRPVRRRSARPVGTTYTLSQVPTHVPNACPFPRSCRCKCSSPQTGHVLPGSSAPEPWRKLSPRTVGEAQPQNRGGSSAPEPWRELSPRTVEGAQPQNRGGASLPLSHKGPHASGWCDAQSLPLRRVCGSPAPAPLSRPAFGGKVFEQVIELNEAIRVGPDPIDPVSLWEEGIRI